MRKRHHKKQVRYSIYNQTFIPRIPNIVFLNRKGLYLTGKIKKQVKII